MSNPLIWIIRTATSLCLLILLMPLVHADEASERNAQSILHMLDYLSVDYGGTVLLGKVLNESEYQEQIEFVTQSAKLMEKLPENPLLTSMISDAQSLARSVVEKAPAEQIATSAQQIRRAIISTYNVTVSPRQIPDIKRGAILFQQNCTKCHGPEGRGDGPKSTTLNPKPANFHNYIRMGKRSVYGLYNTISLGVSGTAMKGFTKLSDDDRWSLAFFVSNLHMQQERLDLGLRLWEKRNFHGAAPSLNTLATLTANEIGIKQGNNTRAVFEYLRAYPDALMATRHATLIFATEQLDHALSSYRNGDLAEARRYAIAAYLEGFEPMEISINNLNHQLRLDIEGEMIATRQLIYADVPVETLSVKIERAKALLRQADELLRDGKLTISGAFNTSLFILLREGLEAILVLAALLAFAVKSGQRNALFYIHSGWIGALLLGALTWITATWLLDISGASREISSGITTLTAAAMLIYMGFWLRKKTSLHVWEIPVKNNMGAVLKKKSLWAFMIITFFAVYREIFETVLYYEALWAQTSETTRPALWGGILMAGLVLLTTGWVVFRLSIKVTQDAFFSVISILLAFVAVIFAGQGVASLQNAGIVKISTIDFISLPMLGVHPTTQTLVAQVATLGILILSYSIASRRKQHNQPDTPSTTNA